MPLPTRDILGVLVDNLGKRMTVTPLSLQKATGWAQGLNIPMGGETVIYTGQMYQLMPAIIAMEKVTSRFEESWMNNFFSIGRIVNKFINTSWFITRTSHEAQETFNNLLRNIACLLRSVDVEFGYLYGEELYVGTLIHDEGVNDVFDNHARKVYEVLRKHGVKQVITVDPHTTNMLRSVYPGIIEGFGLEVKSYLEVLAERNMDPVKKLDLDLVVHDSCVYARYENVIEEPRLLLQKAGVRLKEPEYAKKLTYCCGGPVESLFPGKARAIAEKRMAQLISSGGNVAAMCPICLVNLKNAAAKERNMSVKDISEYLVEAYCDASRLVTGTSSLV